MDTLDANTATHCRMTSFSELELQSELEARMDPLVRPCLITKKAQREPRGAALSIGLACRKPWHLGRQHPQNEKGLVSSLYIVSVLLYYYHHHYYYYFIITIITHRRSVPSCHPDPSSCPVPLSSALCHPHVRSEPSLTPLHFSPLLSAHSVFPFLLA